MTEQNEMTDAEAAIWNELTPREMQFVSPEAIEAVLRAQAASAAKQTSEFGTFDAWMTSEYGLNEQAARRASFGFDGMRAAFQIGHHAAQADARDAARYRMARKHRYINRVEEHEIDTLIAKAKP